MTDVAKLQLIEAHHNNSLTDTQQIEFNKLITDDTAFAAEVNDYDFLLDGFDMLELEVFETQMQQWEKKHIEDSNVVSINSQTGGSAGKSRRLNFSRYIAIAAAVLLIAFTPIAYSLFSSQADLYADMFEAPTAMVNGVRGHDANVDQAEKNKADAKSFALGFYNRKEYTKAAELLNSYVNKYGQEEYDAMLYLGIAQMKNKEFQKASMNLENVYENAGGFNAQTAQWMLVLAQYRLGNESVAKKFAEGIVAKVGHNYRKQAKLFLERL